MNNLMAGAAKKVLKIPPGISMGGYENRKAGNIGTHDNLYTKALALSDGKNTLVVITNDLLAVDQEMVALIRDGLKQQYDIPAANILICASHTHSGPNLSAWNIMGLQLDQTTKEVKKNITNTILDNALHSLKNMHLAQVGFGKSSCTDIASNRIDPNLPVDYSVNVIQIVNENKEPVAILTNYTCHPTVLDAENLYISADYPGAFQRKLEKYYDNKVVAMFTNGACGNQSTRFTRRCQDFAEVERMGELLFTSTLEAIKNITMCRDVELHAVREIVEFPKKNLPSMEEALKNLEAAEKFKEQTIAENRSAGEIRLAFTRYQGAEITVKMLQSSQAQGKLMGELQLIRIGDIELVGVPVELFVEYGLAIKQNSKSKNTIVVGYANDLLGYVYTEEEANRGGYEVWASPFGLEAGNIIVNQVLKLEEKIF